VDANECEREDSVAGSFTFESTDEEEEDEEPASYPFALPMANTDADEAEAEDAETEAKDVLQHGKIPVEPENEHKAKWQKYLLDQAQLLVDGWVVTKSAANNVGISIGATVSTKGAETHRRQGRVEQEEGSDDQGRKCGLLTLAALLTRPTALSQCVHSSFSRSTGTMKDRLMFGS
jgi:hypothetical protein